MFKCFAAVVIIAAGFCPRVESMAAQKTSPDPAVREVERYAVYSAVLNQMFARSSIQLFVIESQTGSDFSSPSSDEWQYIKPRLAPLAETTIENFKSHNTQSSHLNNKFKVTPKVVLISKAEVDQIFGKDGGWWEAFYRKYPNSPGLITFSNAGFNPEMTQALLYVGRGCGGLCGEGNYVLLLKVDGNWKVERTVMTWIS